MAEQIIFLHPDNLFGEYVNFLVQGIRHKNSI